MRPDCESFRVRKSAGINARDAKPRNIIKNWECKLAVGNSKETLIKTGNDFPATFFHELKNFSKELIQSDSLEICLVSMDTLNRNHEYKQVFNVSHSSSTQDKFIIYKNKKYLVYFQLQLPSYLQDLLQNHPFLLL